MGARPKDSAYIHFLRLNPSLVRMVMEAHARGHYDFDNLTAYGNGSIVRRGQPGYYCFENPVANFSMPREGDAEGFYTLFGNPFVSVVRNRQRRMDYTAFGNPSNNVPMARNGQTGDCTSFGPPGTNIPMAKNGQTGDCTSFVPPRTSVSMARNGQTGYCTSLGNPSNNVPMARNEQTIGHHKSNGSPVANACMPTIKEEIQEHNAPGGNQGEITPKALEPKEASGRKKKMDSKNWPHLSKSLKEQRRQTKIANTKAGASPSLH